MTEEKKAKSLVYKPLRWHVPNGNQSELETNRQEALEIVDDTIQEYEWMYKDKTITQSIYDYVLSYWANVEGIIQDFR